MKYILNTTVKSLSRVSGSTVLAAILLASIAASPGASAQIAVIGNTEDGTTDLTMLELQQVYAGQSGRFTSICIQRSLSDAFFGVVLDRTDHAIRKHWIKLLLSGQVPQGPVGLRTDEEVIDYVRSHTGAIGFVSAASVTDDVRLIQIDGRRPGQAGYAINSR
ncbi:MAG: hypothetical protein HKN37_01710 [Rhodothermales bacterium]|nr:hypothetical protein [Rhodothermales bacterium]